MYFNHTHCRACGLGKAEIPTLKSTTDSFFQPKDNKLVEVLDLGVMPLANDFTDNTEEHAGYAPLKLMWCPRCTLGQLSVVVTPDSLYGHYNYVTSHSETMKEHFHKLLKDLVVGCENKTVVEIGSNDGSFLRECQEWGFTATIGIEPARNLAAIAEKSGVKTINRFFTELVARELNLEGVEPDLIVARHVFCHINDWHEAIHALGVLSTKKTLIAIEVPYLPETIQKLEWDQIYHEHLSYMTVKAMEWALKRSMLHIHAVKHYTIHGGAIVMLLRRNDSGIEPEPLEPEPLTIDDLKTFSDRSGELVENLWDVVTDLANRGKTVVGYGASAKATQWIHRCRFTRKHIKYVCDETIQKQYKNMPGTDIPVVHPSALTREIPDYSVCFAWNFWKEIYEKEKMFRERGGKWIIPVPEVKIV